MLDVQEQDTVGAYLGDLMTLVVRATPGPFTVTRARLGRWVITGASGRVVTTAERQVDATLLAAAPPAVRALASAVAAVLGHHRDGGDGICAADGQPTPCTTRRTIEHELAPRHGSAG